MLVSPKGILAKLQEKQQQPNRQEQAAHEVSLYFETLRVTTGKPPPRAKVQTKPSSRPRPQPASDNASKASVGPDKPAGPSQLAA